LENLIKEYKRNNKQKQKHLQSKLKLKDFPMKGQAGWYKIDALFDFRLADLAS